MPLLYLDIETLPEPGVDLERLAASMEPDKRLTDPVKIANSKRLKAIEHWKDGSLDPMRGFIYTVGTAVDSDEPQAIWYPAQVLNDDPLAEQASCEKAILEELEGRLSRAEGYVTWWGYHFDVPFIIKRAMRHKMWRLPQMLRSIPHHDLHRVWQMGDHQARGKLKDVARFLRVPTLDDIDGGQVFQAFMLQDHASVDLHVRCDVAQLQGVGKCLAQSGIWDPSRTMTSGALATQRG